MPNDIDVLCIGILVADLFTPPLPRLPAAGELLRIDDFLLTTGGCAANAGVDLAKLGAKVTVVGKVGNDVYADFIRKDLDGKGVDVSGIRVSKSMPTSRTVILPVVGEDRRYIHAVGANADLRADDISLGLVARSRVLYVGGYLLFPGVDQASLVELFHFARQRGVKTVLDVAGVQPEHGLPLLTDLLPLTDAFLPNQDEARLLTGEADPARQAQLFLDCGAGTVVVTMGGDGAIAKTRNQSLRAAAYAVDVVDPSGGGDAFDAGFITGMLAGWDLRRSIEFASAIGASACTQLGCTAGVFTRSEALTFIARQSLQIEPI